MDDATGEGEAVGGGYGGGYEPDLAAQSQAEGTDSAREETVTREPTPPQAIFVIGAPGSSATALAEALISLPGVEAAPADVSSELDSRAEVTDRGDRLDAADAAKQRGSGWVPHREGTVVDGSPRRALQIPYLAALYDDARFVFVHRPPVQALTVSHAAWSSGGVVTHESLPDWDGGPWSYALVPGWRELSEITEPAELALEQWLRINRIVLDDLAQVPAPNWCVTAQPMLRANPRTELERIARFLGLAQTGVARAAEMVRNEIESESLPEEAPDPVKQVLPRTIDLARRADEWLARPRPTGQTTADPASRQSPLRSVHTGSIPRILDQLGSSLLVSTYQAGKLICARKDGIRLNTHFRSFDQPMGLAIDRDKLAIGVRSAILEFRNMPAAAQKVPPEGTHDACYILRRSHVTGDIRVHDLDYSGGELWFVNTAFSCLCTLDEDHSFVPRWRPPFVSKLALGDRCHLNGMASVDGRIAYVTALGQTDTEGGWRENKASGGCLVHVPTNEVVLEGLSMPHSPRWHDGKLWVLESGKGTLSVVDLDAGKVETVCELPGFTRGLSFAGPVAFVGLSQIRESSTFGGLPLTERVEENLCGVWAVNIETGDIIGFMRFEEAVQEVYDVQVLPGIRKPEIAEAASQLTRHSYVIKGWKG